MADKILAVDIGGSKLLAGVVSSKGEVLSSVRADLPAGYGAAELESALVALLSRVDASGCAGAGVSLPGLADPERGVMIYAPFSQIRDFPAAQIVERATGLRTEVENDVNACAVGERAFGICAGVDDFIWITVSNGVGGAVFARGALYSGAKGNAGEIGHICVVEGGRLCGCGMRGCVEAEASGRAISEIYGEETGERLTTKELADRGRTGDRAAARAFERAGYLVGKAACFGANVLNPEKIVIGGGVSMAFDLLAPGLEKAFETHLFSAANPGLRPEKTGLGYDASLLGAAALVIK